MDAKPLRPLRPLRVTDENMPPSATNGVTGKTLHQRTKSTSALALTASLNNKRVLGEANANQRVATKDDFELGKASPEKISLVYETVIPAPISTFQRPAIRPLASKNAVNANSVTVLPTRPQASVAAPEPQMAKKIVPKKSKVLKDTTVQAETEVNEAVNTVLRQCNHDPSAQAQTAFPVGHVNLKPHAAQHQEVVRTENIPLRDEPASQGQSQQHPVSTIDNPSDLVVASETVPQSLNVLTNGSGPLVTNQQAVARFPMPGDHVYASAIASAEQEELEEFIDDDDQDYITAQSFDLRAEATVTTIFNPQPSRRNQAEIAEAKEWVDINRSPEDIEDEQWDTSMVIEYSEEIFEHMRELETRMAPNPYYMEQQQEIQWSMRGVLMDWVVQVHQRFNLLPETLFLTVNYIDRFLSCKVVSLGKLQLVGATAIFLAAKYEEVNCPTIPEIIYMVDNGYTSDELLKAERFMLSMLQFELGWPGPMSFLRRISKADDYDLETRTLAKYFLEVTIMDERFVGCKPSFLAAGAHCIARMMLRKGDWTKAHVYYSNYTFRQLHRLLGAIYECCVNGQKHHAAVFDKYTDKRYKRASTFVRGEMARGYQLPFNYRSSFGAQHTTTGWPDQ